MCYVYDTSFIGALIIPDEKNPRAEEVHTAILDDEYIFAPPLLWYEITNLFKNLIRRKRYSYDEVIEFYAPFIAIRLTFDHEAGADYSKKLLRLCNDYNLSSYDATYLELAERKNATLCTLDERLQAAAKNYGVSVIK